MTPSEILKSKREKRNAYQREYYKNNRDRYKAYYHKFYPKVKLRRVKNRDKILAYQREWRKENPEKMQEWYKTYRDKHLRNLRKYRQNHPERILAYQREYYRKNTPKKLAHARVRYALRNGKLQKQPCVVCGSVKSEAHHPDYSKPLEVTFLCHLHHCEVHMSVKKGE